MSDETAISVSECPALPTSESQPASLMDFRQRFMTAPVEVMEAALAEYKDRRKTFRDWLKSQLVEGIHFGFAPFCKPEMSADGQFVLVKTKTGKVPVPLAQWTPKPGLYKAGAEFVCDLLYVIANYSADMDGWKQAGEQAGMFVYKCELRSKLSNELLGEGRGIRRIGDKGGDANNAIKMAKKNSLVDATLSAFGLSDLFTQDVEDDPQPPHDNPAADPNAPKTASRDGRCTKEAVAALLARWKSLFADVSEASADGWQEFVAKNCGRRFNPLKANEWHDTDAASIDSALKLQETNV